jgi:L-rhamnose mutarotase
MKCILCIILEVKLTPVSRQMCFVLDLVNDAALIREYCHMHQPGSVWPGVIEHIRAQGVESMEIWQHADRLFMIMWLPMRRIFTLADHEGRSKS